MDHLGGVLLEFYDMDKQADKGEYEAEMEYCNWRGEENKNRRLASKWEGLADRCANLLAEPKEAQFIEAAKQSRSKKKEQTTEFYLNGKKVTTKVLTKEEAAAKAAEKKPAEEEYRQKIADKKLKRECQGCHKLFKSQDSMMTHYLAKCHKLRVD